MIMDDNACYNYGYISTKKCLCSCSSIGHSACLTSGESKFAVLKHGLGDENLTIWRCKGCSLSTRNMQIHVNSYGGVLK